MLAVRVTGYFNSLTKPDRAVCLVLYDSVMSRERSKKVELLFRFYDHMIHKTMKGFNMLTLGWTDGYSFIPVGFNMMASADARKRLMPVSESTEKHKFGYRSRQDAILHKPQAAVKIIHDALLPKFKRAVS